MASDLNEMANAPLSVSIGGREYKAVRPSIFASFARLEAIVVEKELRRITAMADVAKLAGPERGRFLVDAIGNVPRGKALQALVWESFYSPDGLTVVFEAALLSNNKGLTTADIQRLVEENQDEAIEVANLLCGVTKKKTLNPGPVEGPKKQAK